MAGNNRGKCNGVVHKSTAYTLQISVEGVVHGCTSTVYGYKTNVSVKFKPQEHSKGTLKHFKKTLQNISKGSPRIFLGNVKNFPNNFPRKPQ